MISDETVPTKISNLIKRQFPDWYLDHGPNMVAFVSAYYEWLESSGNPLFYARNYYNIKDIDRTFDEFILFFKEKYLKNIQLDTATQTAQLVKHSLDIYRSKGTERCVRLLFQLVYNKPVKFYYPSTDLFKLSDGEWYRPHYLELLLSDNNTRIVNKQIRGLTSGAKAYVDSVVRRRTKGRLHDVAYISAIYGVFSINEKIQPFDRSILPDACPTITGSLTSVVLPIIGAGQNYANGDIVSLSSQYGEGAKALVLGTIDNFGIISSELTDGGYGYTANNDDTLYISNAMFTLSNLQISNSGILRYFKQFDTFSQPQAYYNYNSANGEFTLGENVYTWSAGAIIGRGVILESEQSNTSAGTLLIGVVSGDLNEQKFYTSGNTVEGNLNASNGYYQANATGLFLANDGYVTLTLDNINGAFSNNENVYQPSSQGNITLINGNDIRISNIAGIFMTNYNVTGSISGAIANVAAISIGVGLSNTSGTFYAFANNVTTTPSISGTVSRVESGTGFTADFANNLNYSETVAINTDLLSGYLAVRLNASSYGFPANSQANLTYVKIANSLSFTNKTIGKITDIAVSEGASYTKWPFVKLDYPPVREMQYQDYVLSVSNVAGSFSSGELVSQEATNARGMVVISNDDKLYVQNMRFYQNNRFVPTTNSTTYLVSGSGTTANIDFISFDDSSDPMAFNLDLVSSFAIGNGAIYQLSVIDSGFGFHPEEEIVIDTSVDTTGIANVYSYGTGMGRYKQKGGFLSDQKKLFDGYYWQNYSYEIISSLIVKKYEKMLKQLSHPAGTIMFGRFMHDTIANADLQIISSSITLSEE